MIGVLNSHTEAHNLSGWMEQSKTFNEVTQIKKIYYNIAIQFDLCVTFFRRRVVFLQVTEFVLEFLTMPDISDVGMNAASFKGVLHLLPKISMFCALSQNNQQLFEKKIEKLSMHLMKKCSRKSKMALKF